MLSRNEQKMEQRFKEIKEKYPNITTKGVVADFAQMTTIAEYRTLVEGSLKDIEISIVGLNAGLAIQGSTEEISDENLESVIRVNALHPIYLGKVLVEKMMT